jgi:hypothetical protein
MISTKTQSAAHIQIGDRTHHQDQDILLRSLRTINTMVNKPTKPIPALLLEELLFDFIFISPFNV